MEPNYYLKTSKPNILCLRMLGRDFTDDDEKVYPKDNNLLDEPDPKKSVF